MARTYSQSKNLVQHPLQLPLQLPPFIQAVDTKSNLLSVYLYALRSTAISVRVSLTH